MSKPPTEAERANFRLYLRNCTDRQVRGVWEKEKRANRQVYTQMAIYEAARRCLDTTDWVVTNDRDPPA